MLAFEMDGPSDIAREIAGRVRLRRLESDRTQQGLARRAGVSLSTYRRFEATGEISLRNLILVAVALGAEDDFGALFQRRRYASIDEVIAESSPVRQRGHVND